MQSTKCSTTTKVILSVGAVDVMKVQKIGQLKTCYAPCDFTTYGNCPNCGGKVMDGISGKDEKCRSCGQMLK